MAAIRRIETERLVLEPAFVNDMSKELRQAIHDAGEFKWYFGMEENEERLQEISIKRKRFYNIFDLQSKFIGYIGLHREWDGYGVEIYILKEFRRKGYGKEAMMTILKEAFEGGVVETTKEDFSRIVATVRERNEASKLLMAQCGFEENERMMGLIHYHITRERFYEMQEGVNFIIDEQYFSHSFFEQMCWIDEEVEHIIKFNDKFNIKKDIQEKGRAAYGKEGYTHGINRLFEIIKSDPKNKDVLQEVWRAEKELISFLYDEPGALSEEQIFAYWNSYLQSYIAELDMHEK